MQTFKRLLTFLPLLSLVLPALASGAENRQKVRPSGRTVVAEIVAFDQAVFLNRLGAQIRNPMGMIFALRKDVETYGQPLPGFEQDPDLKAFAGKVILKEYKRARPIVLRANVGDILEIRFTNLLEKPPAGKFAFAGCRVVGLSLAADINGDKGINSDSSFVGNNDNSFAASGGTSQVYRYFVDVEGVFILYSAADPTGFDEAGSGLFGCVIVQPPNAEYYRSQVLHADLNAATFYSGNLPPNMLLHRAPDDENGAKHWFLTTYRTRLDDFVTKNVEVVIGDPEVIQQFHGPVSQEQLENWTAQPAFLKRASAKDPFVAMKPDAPEDRAAQKKGNEVPQGFIYSRDTGHPLINYATAYSNSSATKQARPPGWPVLQMLYPEVKKNPDGTTLVLKAKRADPKLGISEGADFFQLAEKSERYDRAVTQLDTGSVPRDLWPVLNDWGITSMLNLTRVAPQGGYFDGTVNAAQSGLPGANAGYIWLLTGVNVNGAPNSAVIIEGNKDNFTLRFLLVELQLFHSDLTAIITGPQAESFGNMQETPSAFLVPALPERPLPYREFALAYHNLNNPVQAFPQQDPNKEEGAHLASTLFTGDDGFCINYGSAGIAAEILANRLGVGPQGFHQDGVDLKFEEFFLSSWAVGDPAMIVDRPANANQATPAGQNLPDDRATKVCYADDPSNVYHSYMRDHVKMRIYNAGLLAPHVHHLHAHQWLRTPNSDESSYLDSQLLVPGTAFTLDITYNGSGNRNQTVGDSIFHCHFYPHFAQGMWSLWRVHDVMELGTPLSNTGGVLTDPSRWVRALPDGEIASGTPIPAIVPLPTLAMPPIPPPVRVTTIPDLPKDPAKLAGGATSLDDLKKWVPFLDQGGKNLTMGRMVQVKPDGVDGKGKLVFSNPGFPFFVPGVAGHRPPHPPLDMGWEEKKGVPILGDDNKKKYLDGGLPRHQVLGGQIVREFHTPWDFTKDYIRYDKDGVAIEGALVAYQIPEEGTPIELAAMKAHETRTVKTVQPDGRQGNFIHNGLKPISGAPFADPDVDDEGNSQRSLRKYKVAVIQKDVVFNKAGWHYPQQRFLTLWQDVKPTYDGKRPAQPFFFRANSGETVEYWHTNLVPEYYELDDFQVRTPTDIIGQHIHLVKFDVLASDGAVNGFNYEDGTTSPDDVRGRIHAITRPFANNAKYSLFELSVPEAGADYVVGVDWSKFVHKNPEPTPWKDSYLQNQMTQGDIPEERRVPEPQRLQPPKPGIWDGAMTTIQRFSTDPLLNNKGIDRTVRTIFTHDHFGPSTHQQAGLYAGFLVEPEKSVWRDPVTGDLLYDPVSRSDGGPTGWEAIIEPQNLAESYREFAIEFQDLQLAYTKDGGTKLAPFSLVVPSPELPEPSSDQQNLVKNFKVGAKSLTDFLLENGIALTDSAVFVFPPQVVNGTVGIVDAGAGSIYSYYPAPDNLAFTLEKDPANNANLLLKSPHLETWSVPNTAINPAPDNDGRPEIVSSGGGTYSVNYRNEPLSVWLEMQQKWVGRVERPVSQVSSVVVGSDRQSDMAFAFASIDRPAPWNLGLPDTSTPSLFARPENRDNVNGPWKDKVVFPDLFPTPPPGTQQPTTVNQGNVSPLDPYTPLLRGYQGDKIQVRALVGAHTVPHSFTIAGVKWLGEMTAKNSGFKNAQEMGISEHFEFEFVLPPASTSSNQPFVDYLYEPSSGSNGLGHGAWGILRSFDKPPTSEGKIGDFEFTRRPLDNLLRLPKEANPRPYVLYHPPLDFAPPKVPDVEFTISAQETAIVYNNALPDPKNIQNKKGIVYTVDSVREKEVDKTTGAETLGAALPGVMTKLGDPLILRVKAGQWVHVILNNKIKAQTAPPEPTSPSTRVGLHPQLLAYDVAKYDGLNVGFNQMQTAEPYQSVEYWWYAGDAKMTDDGKLLAPLRARELGATNLCPADPLYQDGNGLLGALIVEPENSTWAPEHYLTEQAEINDPRFPKDSNDPKKLLFRDFVLIEQANITDSNKTDNKTKTNSAVNNRSEELNYRLQKLSPKPTWQAYSNELPGLVDPKTGDPKTPIFVAKAGDRVRFRVLQPGGDTTGAGANAVFEIHGHSWQQEPWIKSSRELGDNEESNVMGTDILVPHKAVNILIDSAGGPHRVPGDYLYYNFISRGSGAWGIFRVTK